MAVREGYSEGKVLVVSSVMLKGQRSRKEDGHRLFESSPQKDPRQMGEGVRIYHCSEPDREARLA